MADTDFISFSLCVGMGLTIGFAIKEERIRMSRLLLLAGFFFAGAALCIALMLGYSQHGIIRLLWLTGPSNEDPFGLHRFFIGAYGFVLAAAVLVFREKLPKRIGRT